jgi:hypothetical protein
LRLLSAEAGRSPPRRGGVATFIHRQKNLQEPERIIDLGDHKVTGEVAMTKLRNSLLGACLALPLAGIGATALAASPGCASPPSNAMTVFLPSPGVTQVADAQALRLIADANAMFRRMDAEMNAMAAQMNALAVMPLQLPTPRQVIQAGFGGTPLISVAPGNGVVFTSISNGRGTCSQTITYSYPGHGGQPIIRVSQNGNACGAVNVNGPERGQAAQPVMPHAIQPTVPASSQPHLWQVLYRRPIPARG